MIVWRDSDAGPGDREPSVVAVGVFDGLHLGHQQVLADLRRRASERGARATVVTFDPHPALVLAPERAPRLLGTISQRLEGLERLGIDLVRLLTFDPRLARESPTSFVQRVLVDELHACDVVVGEDFHFGHDRTGDVALLRREGAHHGFEVHPTPIFSGTERWSSTAVRRLLGSGDVSQANAILGRPFILRGVVEHGDARGGELGYPTANLRVEPRQLLPGLGIYAGAAASSDGTWWPAAISVGTRPQFYDNGETLVEAYLVGYEGNLYEQPLDVAFLSRLRGEMAFAGTEQLIEQMGRDVEQTVEIFKNFPPSAYTLLT